MSRSIRFNVLLGRAVLGLIAVSFGIALSSCSSSTPSSQIANGGVLSSRGATPVNLKIVTGKMDGHPGWPEYQPSNFSIPVDRPVVLTIVSYDDGTAPLPAASPWGMVSGYNPANGVVLGGTETVDGNQITSIPNSDISHTLTVPRLLINIPIPAVPSGRTSITVTYTFMVKEKGTFRWLCVAPCGSGALGMGGAMDTTGWMTGFMEVK